MLVLQDQECCRFVEKCSFAHRQVDEQPNKRSKKNDGKSAVAMLKPIARVKMQCTLPCPDRRLYLRMMVLLMVLVMTSMEWAVAPEVLRMKSSMPFSQNLYTSKRRSLKIPALTAWMSRMDSQISNTHGDFGNRLTEMEQKFSALTARMCKFETHAASASNVSGSARSWPTLEQVDGSTAAGSHGPGSTETHDEGLILPQAQKMNNHEVPSYSDFLANNTSKELHSGSIPFGKNLVCWHVTNLKGFIAKQVQCQSGLFLKHEATVNTLLFDKKMMVFLMQSTVPVAAPILPSQCVNPDQLKTERLENNLCRCGKYWLTSLKFSFLMQMTKVYSSSLRSILAHKSSASKIAETELENRFSILLRLVADKRLHLLHLICLFLVFRLRCYNGFSLKPTGLMCDGRSLASPFFRRLAGRGAFFCGFLFRWVFRFVSHWVHGFTFHELSSCFRESSFSDCGRPCDPLSCLLFTALWLRCSQTLVVQETPSAKDVDLTCSFTSLFRAVTCLPIGPMSLDWPVNHFGRSESSVPLLPPDAPSDGLRRVALPGSERSRWRQGTLQAQPQILQRTVGWDGCGPFLSEGLRCITWNTRGLVGSVFSRQRHREVQTQLSQKTSGPQQHNLFPRSTWKRRGSSSYPGLGSAISALWYFSS